MAPNLSKILYHWGLEEEVRSIAVRSESLTLAICTTSSSFVFEMALDMCEDETGEILGHHHWDEELLKEARGEFVFAHVRIPYELKHYISTSSLLC